MRRFTFILCLSILFFTSGFAQSGFNPFDREMLKEYLTTKNFSGAVLLRSDTDQQIQLATGSGNLEKQMPLKSDARFRIASITKLFTAVLIMQLIDQDKLDLNDTVAELLPNAPISNRNKITIRHLLQHTSGLKKETKLSYMRYNSPDELIQRFASKKVVFKPGKDFNYNNIDYIILGKIIEQITGKSFEENLRVQIISKLGLKNTGLDTTFETDLGITQAFEVKDGKRKAEITAHIENIWAAGAMYSTVNDLLVFTDALKAEKLISAAAMNALFKSEPRLGYVALGSWTFNSPFIEGNPRVMERRGGILGSTSVIMTNLNGPETLIVLSNTDEFDPDTFGKADSIKEYLFKSLFSKDK